MKEFITIISAFLIVVGLALYMYVSTQNNTIAVKKSKKLEELVIKNNEDLKKEIQELKRHIYIMDSIYHK